MSVASGGSGSSFTEVWRVAQRGRRLIVQAAVLAAVAALLVSLVRADRYTATASLLFGSATDVLSTASGSGDIDRELTTSEELLELDVVAERARRTLGGRVTRDEIGDAMSVVSTPGSNLVEIEATTDDPALSARMANAYAQAFIAFRAENAQAQLRETIEQARAAEADLTDDERAGPRGEALRERIIELEQALATRDGGARIVQQATPPTDASSPPPLRNAVLAGLLGALLGFLLAALREQRAPTVSTIDELERAFGLPGPARVPPSHAPSPAPPPEDAEAARVAGVARRGGRRPAPSGGESSLDAAWRIARRGWSLIVLGAVLAAVAGLLVSVVRPDRYTASASLLFRSAADVLSTGSGSSDVDRELATSEGLLELDVVAERAGRALGGGVTRDEIGDATTVISTPGSDLVEIEATTDDPALSARMANAYAQAFIAFRAESAQSQLREAVERARAAEADLTDDERAGSRGEALRERIADLEQALATRDGGARVVQQATPPTAAASPAPLRSAFLGGILGALLGFGLAALRERRAPTVNTVDELERAFGLPVLARIPRSRALASGVPRRPLPPEEAEAFRILRAALRHPRRSVLVASARPGEGTSTIARWLGLTMAEMGESVVLVEADMHRRRSATATTGRGVGLSGVLLGADLGGALLEVEIEGAPNAQPLAVLPSGPPPPNPSELLESKRMWDVLLELQTRYDIVIIDTPPLAVLSDALPIVNLVSDVLVVGALGMTTREAIQDFLRVVDALGGHLLGVVANFSPRPGASVAAYYEHQRS